MYCRNCGKEIPDKANFCKYCGTPVDKRKNRQPVSSADPVGQGGYDRAVNERSVSGSLNSRLIVVTVILALTALIALVVISWHFRLGPFATGRNEMTSASSSKEKTLDKDDKKSDAGKASSEESDRSKMESIDKDRDKEGNDAKDEEDDESPYFSIESSTVEDYSNVLSLPDYTSYISEADSSFSFLYPMDLYDDVDYSDRAGTTTDILRGFDHKNKECIRFTGSEGSRLLYQLAVIRGDGSTDQMASALESSMKENTAISSPYTLLKKTKGDKAYVVVTGEKKDGTIRYLVCTGDVSDGKLMLMELDTPPSEDDADKKHKSYYTEVLYRGLSFGYSDASIRSYDDYLGR